MYIYQGNKPPSSPFRKGERGGLCIFRIMNMYMLFFDDALITASERSARLFHDPLKDEL